jgi:sulfite reductase alpha subunit
MAIKHPTPLLDQLETGPWPSFVSDIKQEAEYRAANPDNVEFQVPADAPDDLLGVLELSYKEGETHWKHGGIVGVFGYGGGVIGRYCDQPEMFPGVAHFHTVRVAQPSGKYYSTEFLRGLCDIWELRGSGLTNMHGSTGDIVLIGTQTPQLEEIFYDLTHKLDVDLGGSGSNLRTPAACLGQSRCEYACYNTQDACYQLTMDYQDELHRPAFPYKFKFKFDGCPNGCVAAMARSDFAVVGTWKDDIKIDQEAVKAYVAGEFAPNAGAHAGRDWGKFDIEAEVINLCPSKCMSWDGNKLSIKTADCQPVLVAHKEGRHIAAFHIGWRGNRLRFLQSGIAAFCGRYGLDARDLLAVRGPSLGPQRSEFVNYGKEWGPDFANWFNARDKTMNLWRLTRDQLLETGLPDEGIFGLDLCTASMPDSFFSYRRDGICGRQANVIWIA